MLNQKLDTNTKDFLLHVMEECFKNNITLSFDAGSNVIDMGETSKCSGYFSEGERGKDRILRLAISENVEDWLGTLVHEWCHWTQYKDQCKEQVALKKKVSRYGNSLETFFGVIEGKKVNMESFIRSANMCRNMELDNEKRTVEMIKKWNLPINIPKYIQGANSYVLFYTFTYLSELCPKLWCNKKSPYMVPKIINIMDKEFHEPEFYNTLSDDYVKLVEKHCI